MGWETRRNGTYYYRKVRDGGRVRSEYVGAGPVAEALAGLDAHDRDVTESDRATWAATVQAERRRAEALAEAELVARAMTTAVLIAAGYHTHRRQWRRQVKGVGR